MQMVFLIKARLYKLKAMMDILIYLFAMYINVREKAEKLKKKEEAKEEVKEEAPAPKPDPQIELLTEIRDLLKAENK